mmetsp:Transcript_100283/g.214859  ORF Transcript_100283/g.214859 Transcript_100283/m.214859 type:complete len:351 (-) Transcript_100283:478-1530(-)
MRPVGLMRDVGPAAPSSLQLRSRRLHPGLDLGLAQGPRLALRLGRLHLCGVQAPKPVGLLALHARLGAVALHLPLQVGKAPVLLLGLLPQCPPFVLQVRALTQEVLLESLQCLHLLLCRGELHSEFRCVAYGDVARLHRGFEIALQSAELRLICLPLPLNDELSALPGLGLDDVAETLQVSQGLLLERGELSRHCPGDLVAEFVHSPALLLLHLLQCLRGASPCEEAPVEVIDLALELLPLLALRRVVGLISLLLQALDAFQVPLAHLHEGALLPGYEGGLLDIPHLHHLLSERQGHGGLTPPLCLRSHVRDEESTRVAPEAVPQQHREGAISEAGTILVAGIEIVDDGP